MWRPAWHLMTSPIEFDRRRPSFMLTADQVQELSAFLRAPLLLHAVPCLLLRGKTLSAGDVDYLGSNTFNLPDQRNGGGTLRWSG